MNLGGGPTGVFVLAAGLGSRLRPITDKLPKPLIQVGDKTLLERNLELVAKSGLQDVVINLFHLGHQIRDFVGSGDRWGLRVAYAEEQTLLDSGGGIRNVFELSSYERLLVINSDILIGPDFSLQDLLEHHLQNPNKPQATLVLRPDSDCERYGAIGISENGRISKFLAAQCPGVKTAETLMFLGIHVIERTLCSQMPPAGEVFSITRDIYQKNISDGRVLWGKKYLGPWSDVGTPESLQLASNKVNEIFSVPKN